MEIKKWNSADIKKYVYDMVKMQVNGFDMQLTSDMLGNYNFYNSLGKAFRESSVFLLKVCKEVYGAKKDFTYTLYESKDCLKRIVDLRHLGESIPNSIYRNNFFNDYTTYCQIVRTAIIVVNGGDRNSIDESFNGLK